MIQGIVGRINDEFYVVIHKWVFQSDTTTRGPLAPVLPVVALLITPSTYS